MRSHNEAVAPGVRNPYTAGFSAPRVGCPATMSSFVIDLYDLDATGEKAYEFAITREWLAEALEDTEYGAAEGGPGSLEVVGRKMGDDVLADGRIQAVLSVPCARCNDDIDWPVDLRFAQLFVPRGAYEEQATDEEVELTPQDLERETFVGDEIALDALVRENLILEVPMTPRCPGGCADPAIAAILDKPEEEKKPGPLAGLLDLKDKIGESS
jgi:uncharacterized metal-binding protein YceD (DUF177 family)